MRQADSLTKEYLSNNEIFADVFNYLIYDGQQRILPDKNGKLYPHHTSSNGQRYYLHEQLNQVIKKLVKELLDDSGD